ncbi:MAG: stage II sporulation protein P [Ruminococcus sp.]|nr:stage II sporulation protein P [Ruminococcus sp.]
MTRHKKRRILSVIKCCTMLILPITAAAVLNGAADIGVLFQKAGNVSLGKNEQTENRAGMQAEQSYYSMEFSEDSEDIFNEQYIISEGYGIAEETADQPVVSDAVNPLNAVSENPGPKPYPSEEEWTRGGDIIRTTYGKFSGTTYFDLEKSGQVNNKTSVPNETLKEESRYLPDFTISETSEPQVLIYHTHTTESFEPYVRDFFDASFNYRTTDETKNMVMVGEEICKQLEAQGIGVIHAKDIHDYPSYNGSYARSRETITKILEQYPTIKVVLDIHRDAISNDNGAYQPVVDINGKEAAQIMIISGCDDGTLDMPNYMKNFHFASYLQQQLESDYPGFTRPILFDYRKYNQDLTTGSLLIEVGSHGNTLEQVQYSGQLIGSSLARALNSLK